jgi:hypothetical protein
MPNHHPLFWCAVCSMQCAVYLQVTYSTSWQCVTHTSQNEFEILSRYVAFDTSQSQVNKLHLNKPVFLYYNIIYCNDTEKGQWGYKHPDPGA